MEIYNNSPSKIEVPVFDFHQSAVLEEWKRIGRVSDDFSKICHHLIKLLTTVIVLRDKGFIWDNDRASSLLFSI